MFRVFGLLVTSLFIGLVSTAQAATYYVDDATQVTMDGSSTNPFKTLDDALDGTPALVSGDVIKVGRGSYTLSTSRAIPAGVTLQGGYYGKWSAGAWTVADPVTNVATVNYGGARSFDMYQQAVLDGIDLYNTSGDWAIYMRGLGSRVKNSQIRWTGGAIVVYASAVTIESSKITGNGYANTAIYIPDSPYSAVIQNNEFYSPYLYYRFIELGYEAKAVIRWNTFRARDGAQNAIYSYYGRAHVYQNYFEGREAGTDNLTGTALNFYNGFNIAENNNIAGWYSALYAYNWTMYWGWGYPTYFRNNAIWDGTAEKWGNLEIQNNPWPNVHLTGNCFEPQNFYIYTYQGQDRWPNSVADLEFIMNNDSDTPASGNMAMTTRPASNTGPACGTKGKTAAPMVSKPYAHIFASDDVTGGTYESDISVGPGVQFNLDGRGNQSWNGDESISFFHGDLTYIWSQVSGPQTVTLWPNALGEVTASATTVGKYVFRLQVKNMNPGADNVLSDPATVTVWVQDKFKVLMLSGALRGQYTVMQDAINAAQSGDTIQLPAGIVMSEEYEDNWVFGKANLTFRGTGAGVGGTQYYSRCGNTAFYVEYSQNITIRDMEIVDSCDDGDEEIYFYSSNGIVEKIKMNGKFRDPWAWEGIYAEYTQLKIRNNNFDWLATPIYLYYGNYEIVNNSFTGTYDGYSIEAEYMNDGYDSLLIEGNQFDNKWSSSYGQIYLYYLQYRGPFAIRNNSFRNFYDDAIYAGYVDDGSGLSVQGNTFANDKRYAWHYGNGIELYYSNARIENNIFYATGEDAIYNNSDNGNSSNEVAVVNNVISDSMEDSYGIENYYGMSCPNGNTGHAMCQFTVWAQGNLLFGNGGGSYRNVDVRDGNFSADPQFVNANGGNFALQADSPLQNLAIGTQGLGGTPPAGLKGEALEQAARISFDGVEGATGYKVFWGEKADQYVQSQDLGAERVVTIDGLAAMPYYFAVASRNANGEGVKSASIIVTPRGAAEPVSEPAKVEVNGVEPYKIKANAAADLKILGAGFVVGAKVYAGSTEIQGATVIDGNTIEVKGAKVARGIYPVVVVNPDLGRGALAQGLIVSAQGQNEDGGGCATTGGDMSLALVLLGLVFAGFRRFVPKAAVALALLLALGVSNQADAAIYYVDDATQVTMDGTSTNPFKTIDDALDGTPVLVAGDVIKVASGTYTLSANRTVPQGVTLQGGYLGNWVPTAWTTSDPVNNISQVNGGSFYFFLNQQAIIDGLSIYTTSTYNIYAQGLGGVVRNSTLRFGSYGVWVNAQAVTVETTTFNPNGSSYGVYISTGYSAVIQSNKVRTSNSLSYFVRVNSNARAVIRWNDAQFYDNGSYAVRVYSNAKAHIYQNYFRGGDLASGEQGGTGIGARSGSFVLAENNNLDNYYTAILSQNYYEYWGWNYPSIFRNNAVWNGVGERWGNIEIERMPYHWTQVQGNCIEPSNHYLNTYQGQDRWPSSLSELEQVFSQDFGDPSSVTGNVPMTARPASNTGPACVSKGWTATPMQSKPMAHIWAFDDVTGGTYENNIAVGPGIQFGLDGRGGQSWNGDESFSFHYGDLTYVWSQVSGPQSVTLWPNALGEVTASATVVGKYVFQLRVKNGNPGADNVLSDPAFVTVWVQDKFKVLTSAGATRGQFSFFQDAIDAAQSGDTVQLPAGIVMSDENEGQLEIYAKSNLTIRGAGSSSSGTQLFIRCDSYYFDIQYSQKITIRDFELVDACDQSDYQIYFYYSSGIVENIKMSGKGRDPWSPYGVYGEYADLIVRNNNFEFTDYPVYQYYGAMDVRGNAFTATYDHSIESDYLSDGINSLNIENNTFDNMWASSSAQVDLYYFQYAGKFTIRNNAFSNFYEDAIYAEYIYYGAILDIEGNTFANDRRYAWHYGNGVQLYQSSAHVDSNTFYGTGESAIYSSGDSGNSTYEVAVRNNVIAFSMEEGFGIENYNATCPNGDSNHALCLPTTWAQGNLLYGNGGGSYRYVDVRDGNFHEDPLFVNADAGNFTPSPGSPLQNAAIGTQGQGGTPPAGLSGVALEQAARISFDKSEGAVGYTLYWGEKAGEYPQSKDLGAERVATIEGLAAMPYYFAVASRNGFGTGVKSAAIIVTPLAAADPVSAPVVVEVNGVEPYKITANAATDLKIVGAGFVAGAKAYAGSTELGEVTLVDANTITVKGAKLGRGIYPVVVVNPDLGRGALSQALIVSAQGGDEAGGCATTGGSTGWAIILVPLALVAFRRRNGLMGRLKRSPGMFSKFMAAAILMFFSGSQVHAATYYVDDATQGTMNGTFSYPFKTIDDVLDGTPALNAGDEIRVARGTYVLSAARTIPQGVTLKGGYYGKWAPNAWTTFDPVTNVASVTYNTTTMFYLNEQAVLEGLTLNNSSGNWAVQLNGLGSIFRNNTFNFVSRAVLINANAVTVETSRFLSSAWSAYGLYVNGGSAVVQNNIFDVEHLDYFVYVGSGKAVVRWNQFLASDSSYYGVYSDYSNTHAYQNYFRGRSPGADALNGTAIYLRNSLSIAENNNISGFYTALSGHSWSQYWGWDYPQIFRNNAIWDGTTDVWGNIAIQNNPWPNVQLSGNCIEPTQFYVNTDEGQDRWPSSIAELELIMNTDTDTPASGNVAMTTRPVSVTGPACGNKGKTAAPMVSKPFAHIWASDAITGGTYEYDIAVGPGIEFNLDGYGNQSWNGDESISFFYGDLTYVWSQVSGPQSVTLWPNAPGEVTASATTVGKYVFKLQVKNENPGADNVLSDPAFVTVWVQDKFKVLAAAGTIRGSYRLLQDAIDAAQPGDTVQFPAGIVMSEENEGNWIAGKSNVTLRGAGAGVGGTQYYSRCNNDAFYVEFSQNITIRDMEIVDACDGSTPEIYFYSSSGVIENIKINAKYRDPWSWEGVQAEYSQLKIRNNNFDFMDAPIEIEYGNYEIVNNTFQATSENYAIDAEYLNDGYDSLLIEGNTFNNMWASSESQIYIYDVEYDGPFIIRNNSFRNASQDIIDIEYSEYGPGIQVLGNTFANDKRYAWQYASGVDVLYSNVRIENNIFYAMGESAIYNVTDNGSSSNEVAVISNVIADTMEAGYGIENEGMNCPNGNTSHALCRFSTWAQDNLLYGNGGGPYRNVDVRDGNLSADPLFVNADGGNFALQNGSPLQNLAIGTQGVGGMPPEGLTGEALEKAARITFDEVQGAAGYIVYWGEKADQYVQSQDLGAGRVVTIDGLAAMPYYFAVASRNANGTGVKSASIIVTPLAAADAVSEPAKVEVNGIEPYKIKANAAADLKILGAGFVEGARVYVGSTEIEGAIVINENTIEVKGAKIARGIYPVAVVNTDLGRGALSQALIVSVQGQDEDGGGCATKGGDMSLALVLLGLVFAGLRRFVPKTAVAIAVLLALGASTQAEAATYYVDDATQVTMDGSSTNPFKTIDDALDGTPALASGDIIKVAQGTYTLTATRTIPAGVTLKGGYVGTWVANAWTTSDPVANVASITYNPGSVFNIGQQAVLDGVTINTTSGSAAVNMQSFGGVLRNSKVNFNATAVYMNANAVTAETSTFTTNNWASYVFYVPSGTAVIQNNVIDVYYVSYYVYSWCCNTKLVIRWNEFRTRNYVNSAFQFYRVYAHIYQNYVQGSVEESEPSGTALNNYYGLILAENNNFEGWYTTISSQNYLEYWGSYYPHIYRNNAIWRGTGERYGNIYVENMPYHWTQVQGNCIEPSLTYLYTYEGQDRWPSSLAEFEQVFSQDFDDPASVTGNVPMTARPASDTGPACGAKGKTAVAMQSKPVAHIFASDDITGGTYENNIAVGPGIEFNLDGRGNQSWNGTESISFFYGDLTYVWSQVSGPQSVTLWPNALGEVTASATTVGKYVFSLQVRNTNPGADNVLSDAATVTVWVQDKFKVLTSAGATRGQFSFLQDAIDAAQSGDTVQLPAGIVMSDENDGQLEIYGKANLTIRGMGMNAGGTQLFIRCDSYYFDVQYSHNITIKDMEIVDACDYADYQIYYYSSSGVVENIKMSGKGRDPWSPYGFYGDYAQVTLRNNSFEYTDYPIYLNYGNYDIRGNAFMATYDYSIEANNFDDGPDSYVIENNTFDNMWAGSSASIYIEDSEYGGPFAIRGNSFRNFYDDAVEAYYVYSGVFLDISGNTFANDKRYAWHYANGLYLYQVNARVENNTFYATGDSAIYAEGDSSWSTYEVAVLNNVIAYSMEDSFGIENYNASCPNGDSNHPLCVPTTWAQGNLLYGNGAGAYRYVDVRDGNINEDPMFVNANAGNFTLLAGSPLVTLATGAAGQGGTPPEGLKGEALEQAVRISFEAVDGASGYKVYWGENAGSYSQSQDLGSERVVTIEKLAAMPYYFAVSSRNGDGEGVKSASIIVTPLAAAEPVSAPVKVEVHGIEPYKIKANAASDLKIVGSGFVQGAKAYAGSADLGEVTVIDENTIEVKGAKLGRGIYPIVIVNPDLGRGALSKGLIVSAQGDADAAGCASAGGDFGLGLVLLGLVFAGLRRFIPKAAVVLALLAVVATGTRADAATYYVDDATQVTMDGSGSNPFKTIDDALDGTPVLVAGDVIKVASGTYTLSANRTVPQGVTLQGGYLGNWVPTAWTTSDPVNNISQVNGGSFYFILNQQAIIDGLSIYTTSTYNIYAQGLGAVVRNSTLRFGTYGVWVIAQAVTVETTTFNPNGSSYGVYINTGYSAVIQNNKVRTTNSLSYFVRVNTSARAVIRWNDVQMRSSSYAMRLYSNSKSHIYQNYFRGADVSNSSQGSYGAYVRGGALAVIENNNFDNFYTALSSDTEAEYWGWDYPTIFRNNAVWSGTLESWGNIQINNIPYQNTTLQGNCIEPTRFYLVTEQNPERFPNSVAELEQLFAQDFGDTRISGNTAMTARPSIPTGPACGTKGWTATPMQSKPFAHIWAYDAVTGGTYENNIAVGPGIEFALDGRGSSSWNGDESVSFFYGDLTYVWSQVSGPQTVSLWTSALGEVTASATAVGKYVFQLRVKNTNPGADAVLSDPAYVTVWVQDNFKVLTAAGSIRGQYRFLQDAIDAALMGDIVQLPQGIVMGGQDSWDSAEIYGRSNLTIRGAGSGSTGTQLYVRCVNPMFDVRYSQNIVIRDLEIVDACDYSDYQIDYESSSGIVENVKFSGRNRDPWAAYGIEMEYSQVIVRNSNFDFMDYGIYMYRGNYEIRNNTFTAIYDYGIEASDMSDGPDSLVIEDNSFDGQWASYYHIYVSSAQYAGPFVVRNNTMRNFYEDAVEAYSINNGGILDVSGNTFSNDPRYKWHYGSGVYLNQANARVENNIFHATGESAIYSEGNNSGSSYEVGVKNNVIAYTTDDGFGIENYNAVCPNWDSSHPLCRPTTWAQGNMLYSNGGGSYRYVDVRDGNTNEDPMFVNADAGVFTLQSGSPLLGRSIGVQGLGGVPPADLVGEALEQAVRISFGKVEGALGYKVYWGDMAGEFVQSKDLGAERVATIDGLAAAPYYFAVSSRNDVGEGVKSRSIIVTPLAAAEPISTPAVLEVNGVEPSLITAGVAADLKIIGAGFVEGAKVMAGSTEIGTTTVIDGNLIEVKGAKISRGIYPIVVVNPDLGRGALPNALTVRSAATGESGGCATAGGDAGFVLILATLALVALRRRTL